MQMLLEQVTFFENYFSNLKLKNYSTSERNVINTLLYSSVT